MTAVRPIACILLFVPALLLGGDLEAVKAVPDLNHRAEMAMVNADQQVDVARKAWAAGTQEAAARAVTEIQTSVQLAYDSLKKTGKSARNNKYYKRVELNMTEIGRAHV